MKNQLLRGFLLTFLVWVGITLFFAALYYGDLAASDSTLYKVARHSAGAPIYGAAVGWHIKEFVFEQVHRFALFMHHMIERLSSIIKLLFQRCVIWLLDAFFRLIQTVLRWCWNWIVLPLWECHKWTGRQFLFALKWLDRQLGVVLDCLVQCIKCFERWSGGLIKRICRMIYDCIQWCSRIFVNWVLVPLVDLLHWIGTKVSDILEWTYHTMVVWLKMLRSVLHLMWDLVYAYVDGICQLIKRGIEHIGRFVRLVGMYLERVIEYVERIIIVAFKQLSEWFWECYANVEWLAQLVWSYVCRGAWWLWSLVRDPFWSTWDWLCLAYDVATTEIARLWVVACAEVYRVWVEAQKVMWDTWSFAQLESVRIWDEVLQLALSFGY